MRIERNTALRIDLIRCEICKKEHDLAYAIPPAWIETLQYSGPYRIEEKRHFCSLDCLKRWIESEEQVHE